VKLVRVAWFGLGKVTAGLTTTLNVYGRRPLGCDAVWLL
jgi:hypothetical protein